MFLNKINKMFLCASLVLCSFVYTQDVEIGFGAVDLDAGTMELTMNTPYDVGGFQFNVEGTVLGSASGGLAADAGFTVSTGGTTILGFSFTGTVIPAGSNGVLTIVEFTADGLEACLDLGTGAISDGSGIALDVSFGDCVALGEVVEGCTDMDACNYDENANTDDGSCIYAEENYDCDGNCTVEEDCNGDCGGDAMEDCNGDCGGDAVVDECGECGGDGTSCTASISFGFYDGAMMDVNVVVGTVDLAGFQFNVSGIILGGATGGLAEENGFTVSTSTDTVIGFSLTGDTIPAGSTGVLTTLIVSGTDDIEACMFNGVFSDPDGGALDYLMGDCLLLCSDGDADDDGICDEVDDCIGEYDCAGECNGDAVVDECGECGGDGVDEDGDGICDDVDDCVGEYDDCGVCNGDDTSCLNVLYFGTVSESADGNSMDIYLSAVDTVAGFQFDVTGVTLNDATGGVEDNGWTVSFNETGTVIGFSLTGDTLAPGEHLLTTLDFNVADFEGCLTFDNDGALADADGNTLPSATGDCVTFTTAMGGCTDMDACNYDEGANVDDGSCTYPEGTCDCDGNPIDDYCDCDGNMTDECGECGGDGIPDGECDCDGNVEDCAGECGGDAVEDECGECNGDGASYECPDGTIVCDASECASEITIAFGEVTDSSVEITYDSTGDIGGFQFTMSGLYLLGASGGAAEDAGFTVSVGYDTGIVIGFAFDGSTIDAGAGTLTVIEAANPMGNAETCLSDVIISDPNAQPFEDVMMGDCADLSMLSIDGGLPSEYSLSQNYPNPFNPVTNISFSIIEAGNISLKVYDLSGKEISELANGFYVPGNYDVRWDAVDAYGNEVSSGIYIYQLITQDVVLSNRMVLMR